MNELRCLIRTRSREWHVKHQSLNSYTYQSFSVIGGIDITVEYQIQLDKKTWKRDRDYDECGERIDWKLTAARIRDSRMAISLSTSTVRSILLDVCWCHHRRGRWWCCCRRRPFFPRGQNGLQPAAADCCRPSCCRCILMCFTFP